MRQVRMAWNIYGHSGAGDWREDTDCQVLLAWVEKLNSVYGPGTYWIEEVLVKEKFKEECL